MNILHKNMDINKFNPAKSQYSITSRQHPFSLNKFEDVISSLPYIDSWCEFQYLDRDEPKLRHILEFNNNLNITDQVFSSVANHLYNSDLRIKIINQSQEGIIVKIPELEKEVLDLWYYETYNENR